VITGENGADGLVAVGFLEPNGIERSYSS